MSDQNIDIEKIEPLDDRPVSQDKFKGHSHENVADALVKLISKTEGGYAIGLEGSWGSGKSTVINIAENKLNKENNSDTIVFFSFDAWARQGDPIRRSFLELLINFLGEKNIINKKNWEKTLKKIQSRTQEETKYTKPKFTRFGKMMAFYGLLFPFLVIFTREVSNDYSYWTTGLYIFTVSLLAPFFIICIEKIIRWWCEEEQGDSLIPSMRLSHHEVKTEQFIKEKDATTIEFNKYFDDLVEEVSKKEKKLVVVIDNLDRLTPDAIKSIWGTMRNFFTTEHTGVRYNLLKSVYLIVPYDLNYISTIFSNENKPVKQVEDTLQSQNNRSESGFIDKTFKLSFQVSPPILSHWKSFFYEQLDIAFNNQLKDSLKHDLYKLFEFKYHEDDEAITPRSIKKFVNSLVVQVIEWRNEIPVKYLALYVLHKNDITLNYRKFVENSILDQRTRSFLSGDNWIQYLAAAYHKVDPKSALQISLGEPIKRALVNGNVSELQEFKKNDWFAITLSFVFEDNCREWASNEPDTYSTAAETLSKINLENKHAEQDMWDNLAKYTSYFKTIKKPSEKLTDGLESIIKNCTERLLHDMARNILTPLANVIDEEEDPKVIASKYFRYVFVLFLALENRIGNNNALALLKHVKLPTDSKFIIYFSALVEETKKLELKYFQDYISADGIEDEIKNLINKDRVYEKLSLTVRALLKTEIQLKWEEIVSVAHNRLKSNDPAQNSDDISILLNILMILKVEDKGDASARLTQLEREGVLLALMSRVEESSCGSALIILELAKQHEIIDSINAKNNVPTYNNNQPGLNRLKEICSNPSEYEDIVIYMAQFGCSLSYFQVLLNAFHSNKDEYEIFEKVINNMLEDECISGISLDYVIGNDFVDLFEEEKQLQIFFSLIDRKEHDLNPHDGLNGISVSFLKNAFMAISEIIVPPISEHVVPVVSGVIVPV